MGSAERQAAWRKRMQERGFKAITEWVPPEHLPVYREIAAILRDGGTVEEKEAYAGDSPAGELSPTGQRLIITEASVVRYEEARNKRWQDQHDAKERKAAENKRAKEAKIEDEHRRAEMAYKASPWELEVFPILLSKWSEEDERYLARCQALGNPGPIRASAEHEQFRVDYRPPAREVLGARLIKEVKKTHKTARVALYLRPVVDWVPQIGKEYYTAKSRFTIEPGLGRYWAEGAFTIFRDKDLEAVVLYALANGEKAFDRWVERRNQSSAHFEVLGLNPGATQAEIKAAYRRAASEHHPDRGGDEARFKEIRAAYEALS